MGAELRQHPRFRVALRAHVATARGTVTTTTIGVSRAGMSVKLTPVPALDDELPVSLELPTGTSIDGLARCKSIMPGGVVGLHLTFTGDALQHWGQFVDEEESTGSIWRMIGRYSKAPDDPRAIRGFAENIDAEDLRFHTVGENGEAYRVAFEKHASDEGEQSDLALKLPGFKEQARRLVTRVLREPLIIRFDESGKVLAVRVAELQTGGYAYVQGGDEATPVGLVSLCVGEMIVVSRNGNPVFPHFTDDDLERVACDTFRRDLPRAVFLKTASRIVDAEPPRAARPAPVTLPPLPAAAVPERFKKGIDAVRFAQAAADDVQVRRYGDRDIFFHPSVWARVKDNGIDAMGPTIHDGVRICVLVLVGAGAPRVVRLDESSEVTLLKPPRGA